MIEPALHAVVADHVFDGAAVHERAAVIMHGTGVAQVVAAEGRAADGLRPDLT